MMLPAIGQTEAVWVSVTRIEAVNWKHSPVYSQFADLRVRSAFADNGDLVWTESFGPSLNPIVDKIKTFIAKKNLVLNDLKKVKNGTPKPRTLKGQLKPTNKAFRRFMQTLKSLGRPVSF